MGSEPSCLGGIQWLGLSCIIYIQFPDRKKTSSLQMLLQRSTPQKSQHAVQSVLTEVSAETHKAKIYTVAQRRATQATVPLHRSDQRQENSSSFGWICLRYKTYKKLFRNVITQHKKSFLQISLPTSHPSMCSEGGQVPARLSGTWLA